MKPTFVFPVLTVLLILTSLALAQERKPLSVDESRQFIVSARAGGVNVADGDVTVKKGQADWQIVVVGDSLEPGQAVKTGAESRAEVLLNPGSYLRVNENSEFQFDSTDLNDLKVRVLQGSVIIEEATIKGVDGKLLSVETPAGSFDVMRAGIYRFDVPSNASVQAEVIKGRLAVNGTEIKEGKKASLNGSATDVSSFAAKDKDSFEVWSQERAKLLVAANATVMDPSVDTGNLGFAFLGNSLFSGLWDDPFYSCNGWWGFDPLSGTFIYLPSSFGGCSYVCSPYGYVYTAYGSPLRHYRPIVNPPPSSHHHHRGVPTGTPIAGRTLNGAAKGNRLGIARGSNSLGIQRSGGFSGGGRVSNYGGGRVSGYGGGGRVGGSSGISTGAVRSMPSASAPVSAHSSGGRGH